MMPLKLQALLFGFFYVGILVHLLVRAGYAFRSQVNNYPTRLSFFTRQWDTIIARTFFSTLLFAAWMTNPGLVSKVAISLGVPAWMGNWLTIPVTLGSAAMVGFFADVLLDSIQSVIASLPQLAWLNAIVRGQVPSYDATVVDVAKLREKEQEGTKPSP